MFKEAGRDSEGFEEFEEMLLLNQSPRSSRPGRRTPVTSFPEDDSDGEDNGDDQEQSMSIVGE